MAAPTAPACSLRGVARSFSGRVALAGVDLDIPAGQRVALVGPSGAGKTTLLRVMAGQLAPDRGTVALHGDPVAELDPRRERPAHVGMMSQRLDLIPHLSVRHNVQAGLLGRWSLLRSLAALLLPVESPAARAAVARVGLEDRFHDRIESLSGGERQRVALARLLVQDPRVLLADEPIASLDPARSGALLDLLASLTVGGGRTLVLSLHEPSFARQHCDRVVGMRHGRIAFDRAAADVTDDDLAAVYELEGAASGLGLPAHGGPPAR